MALSIHPDVLAYNLTRTFLAIILAVVFGLIFEDVDYALYSGLNSGVGMIFIAALFNCMKAFQSVLPLSCSIHASFYRERASDMYNAFWYFVGSTLAEIPNCFMSSLILTVIFYPFVISVVQLVMRSSPPAYAIPSGYQWVYEISPMKFPLSFMVALVFADCDELPTTSAWSTTLSPATSAS
ncbi:ATP-binding Cassette (ABC) superfamily [Phytophthora infestans T30-4]|uniref:ATP-binding Cassette (ABC) superfamily n=1 Tax=Phytophthora infestans (strain T30-4) TaxID=403677 RepID=D0P0X7_PHYIT|nr:ATP-binding Cassette (ABC) superfamily [Phytophthora infestans T30-4]EEY53685.1 ATP-binding Cassette (ABC) superfamily [Phytophthora infestans T30-4]|eukprot:XP_002896039.1 ATP-binding Cassette (ABC) superfamily [Phytophthora infestans T30-4]